VTRGAITTTGNGYADCEFAARREVQAFLGHDRFEIIEAFAEPIEMTMLDQVLAWGVLFQWQTT
jgi:hypothetical protein